MGAVRSVAILTAGAAIGVAALITYRISQESGKPLQEAIADVPAELERLYGEIKVKCSEALEKSKAVYEEKQHGFAEQLKEFGVGH